MTGSTAGVPVAHRLAPKAPKQAHTPSSAISAAVRIKRVHMEAEGGFPPKLKYNILGDLAGQLER